MPNPKSASVERIAYIDGGSRGNPGPAGYGVVIQDDSGKTIETLREFLGRTTNNVAEYRGLLAALEYAEQNRVDHLKIYCDSELVVRQMQGRYRVQSPDLKPLYETAKQLVAKLRHFSISHIPREQNREADELANQAMDQGRVAQSGNAAASATRNISARSAAAESALSFVAVVEQGCLRPVAPLPDLQEGAEYEVRVRRR